jgi:hypothetical protein
MDSKMLGLGTFIFTAGGFLLIGIDAARLAFSSFDIYFIFVVIAAIVGGTGMLILVRVVMSDMPQPRDPADRAGITAFRAFGLNFFLRLRKILLQEPEPIVL